MTQPPIDDGSQPAQQPEPGPQQGYAPPAPQPGYAQAGPQPGQGGPYYAGTPHYQGAPYPQAGPYQPGVAYQPPFNAYAIVSLVLSVAVFPPLGIYFGYKAKEQIARTGERGIELATVGVIVGWVFTGLAGVLILLWCGMALTMFGATTVAG
jgi:hypothetical protein